MVGCDANHEGGRKPAGPARCVAFINPVRRSPGPPGRPRRTGMRRCWNRRFPCRVRHRSSRAIKGLPRMSTIPSRIQTEPPGSVPRLCTRIRLLAQMSRGAVGGNSSQDLPGRLASGQYVEVNDESSSARLKPSKMNVGSQVRNVDATKFAPTNTARSKAAGRFETIRPIFWPSESRAARRCFPVIKIERLRRILFLAGGATSGFNQAEHKDHRVYRAGEAQDPERRPPAVTLRQEPRQGRPPGGPQVDAGLVDAHRARSRARSVIIGQHRHRSRKVERFTQALGRAKEQEPARKFLEVKPSRADQAPEERAPLRSRTCERTDRPDSR